MKYTEKLLCPNCGADLSVCFSSLKCSNGHCFDISKEGYVNLLTASHKNGELMGDSPDMAKSRKAFLEKGFFSTLSDEIAKLINTCTGQFPCVVDICCGEGYYSQQLLSQKKCELYGFDLSKVMVRLAAKRKLDETFFVANLSHIPLKNGCADAAFHLFAPFHEKEFSRILKKGGILFTAVPGENHLLELKEAVYDTAYKNDEALPETSLLTLTDKIKVSSQITLETNEDIMSLFNMTPYSRRTSEKDRKKLEKISKLTTQTEFVIGVYKNNSN